MMIPAVAAVGLSRTCGAVEMACELRLKRGAPGASMAWTPEGGERVDIPIEVVENECLGKKYPEACIGFWLGWRRFSSGNWPFYYVRPTINFKEPIPLAGRPEAVGVWVKGNSNWGAVRFEIVDAKGITWDNYMYGWDYNPFDWGGTQCVDFDGWSLVTSHFSKAGPHWDDRFGLIGQAIHWPWSRRHDYGDKPTYPIKVKAVSFEFYTEKFCLHGWEKSAPTIRIQDVVGIE